MLAIKSLAGLASLVALIPAVLADGDMMVNTPASATVCEPLLISWTGGEPPYYLTAIPAGQPSAPALKQFPEQNGTSYTWMVDLPANYNCALALKDSTGQQVFSATVAIQGGHSDGCVNSNVLEDPSSTTSATGTGATSNAVAAATTPPAPNTTGTAPNPTHPSGTPNVKPAEKTGTGSPSQSGATSTSSPSPGVKANSAEQHRTGSAFGLAGLMGLVGVALL